MPTPRLEIVNLEARPRILTLRTAISPGITGNSMGVRMGHVALGRFAITEEVEIGQQSIVHSGWSMVDLVRRVDGTTRLVGSFHPPANALPGQRFDCLAERRGEAPSKPFSWSAEAAHGNAEAVDFEINLGTTPGLVRLRFVATGKGPPARWQELFLEHPAADSTVPSTETPSPPRVVLLYVLDALRADSLGHRGGRPESSPTIDRLAATGISFARHHSMAPSTLPSTKTLFTGQVFLEGEGLPPACNPTLAGVYSSAGYTTASFSGNGFVSDSFGLTRGFEHAELIPAAARNPGSTFNDSAERVHEAALAWLAERDADEKLFLYVHTVNPHNPTIHRRSSVPRWPPGCAPSSTAAT